VRVVRERGNPIRRVKSPAASMHNLFSHVGSFFPDPGAPKPCDSRGNYGSAGPDSLTESQGRREALFSFLGGSAGQRGGDRQDRRGEEVVAGQGHARECTMPMPEAVDGQNGQGKKVHDDRQYTLMQFAGTTRSCDESTSPNDAYSRALEATNEVFAIDMKLALPMAVAGPPWSPERRIFEKDVLLDLSRASGLPANRFVIRELSAGSIVVHTEIQPAGGSEGGWLQSAHLVPEEVAKELVRQCADASSELRAGVVTRYVQEISFKASPRAEEELFETQRVPQMLLPIDVKPLEELEYSQLCLTSTPNKKLLSDPSQLRNSIFPQLQIASEQHVTLRSLLDSPSEPSKEQSLSTGEEGLQAHDGRPAASWSVDIDEENEVEEYHLALRVISADNLPSRCAGFKMRDTYLNISVLDWRLCTGRQLDDIGHEPLSGRSHVRKDCGRIERLGASRTGGRVDVASLWPQFQTRVALNRVHGRSPVWKEDYSLTTALENVEGSRRDSGIEAGPDGDSLSLSEQPLKGQRVALLFTVHNIDAFEEHSLVGKVLHGEIAVGHSKVEAMPLQTGDGSHVFGDDGRPSCLRLGVEYVAQPLVRPADIHGSVRSAQNSKGDGHAALGHPVSDESHQKVTLSAGKLL